MRLIALQQSEELRARLNIIDETGSNGKDVMRKFGYSLRGQRCIAKNLLV